MSRLKELRKQANLTQIELSKKLGISNSYYSLLERGKKDMTLKILNKLVNYYDDASLLNEYIKK